MERSDSSLWALVRAGDADAFGELFSRYADLIYNFCFRRTGEPTTAEDLMSIVFLEAWRQRETPIEDGRVAAWLYGVATNVIRNRWRSERRYRAALRRMPTAPDQPDFSEQAIERASAETSARCWLPLLLQLPKREQDVFVLCAWSGLTYEDAAYALGIPVGTVRSRLSRARNALGDLIAASDRHVPSLAFQGGKE